MERKIEEFKEGANDGKRAIDGTCGKNGTGRRFHSSYPPLGRLTASWPLANPYWLEDDFDVLLGPGPLPIFSVLYMFVSFRG